MRSKVSVRGQVSIPAKIRKKFKIDPDSKVEWITEGNTIRVIPLPKDPISAFRGKGKGAYTTTNLAKDREEERRLEDKKERGR